MKTALFTNFSTEVFEGYWDGKKKVFQPGQSVFMPDYLAAHFAKHLVNRELLRKNDPKLDRCTSPKKPQDVPEFMELYNKAYKPDEEIDTTEGRDELDVQMDVISRSKTKKSEGDLVTPTMEDDEDEDDEDSFPTKPGSNALGAKNEAPDDSDE